MQKLFGILGLAMVTMGCAEDVLSRLCIDDDATFDIEEVSVLEDAMGEPGTHDAVIVGYDSSQLEVGALVACVQCRRPGDDSCVAIW